MNNLPALNGPAFVIKASDGNGYLTWQAWPMDDLVGGLSGDIPEWSDLKPKHLANTGALVAELMKVAGSEMQLVVAMPIDIVPDTGMAGVVGDVVKSLKKGSKVKHFVTPKKSDELDEDHVVLKAAGITVDQITPGNSKQIVEWDTSVGEPVPNEPLK